MKDKVRINGFRPGKVPVAHLKKVYGRSAMAEVIEATVRDTNNQIVTDRGFKLAADPKVTLPEDKDAVEQLINGQSDLSYTVGIEIVPEIKLADFKQIKLTRPVAEVGDEQIDEGIKASPIRTSLMRPRPKAPRPRPATASTSPLSAPSTARPSTAAPATTSPCRSAPTPSFRASKSSSSASPMATIAP